MIKLRTLLTIFLALGLSYAHQGMAQEKGNWRPSSKTAQSITGEIAFGNEKLMINFLSITVAEIRSLTPTEILAAFSDSEAGAGTGHLYRLSIPADKRFLHKNTICGVEETQWMATYVSGKQLEIAFFSNATPPLFTTEALGGNANLCGIFSYAH
ncbi:hypothetical protein [Granulicella arctica]|uniref:hypothetical protein n=1 Tax=Granulicella arctica TaxID=940613 RepID=UPI0021DFC8CC|nr:hypothetical protein [Granulicella arctica]